MAALTQISGYAHVAERYGFKEAVFLDSIVYWYRTNRANGRNFRDGRWWTYNSIKAFVEVFPWWTAKQIRRIANSCREQGAIIAGEYNEDRRDRSLWYTPGDELLALYGLAETGNCTCPNGQMHEPEQADEHAQMGECNIRNTCNYHEETNMYPPIVPPDSPQDCRPIHGSMDGPPGSQQGCQPGDSAPADKPKAKPRRRGRAETSDPVHDPEAFRIFWDNYPRKDGRKKAADAWDKLKPDRTLCRTMFSALKAQCRDPKWAEDGGRFIPYFSTWLNQRRWENTGVDLSRLQPLPVQGPPGGWADDPER